MKILRPKSVWITFKPKLKRWEVGVYWQGKPERFYQFKGFSHVSEEIAEEHAGEIRTEIRKGTFDPGAHKRRGTRHSPYLFEQYVTLWLREYDQMVVTGDRNPEYVMDLYRYNRLYWGSHFNKLDIREINEPLIKSFYLSLNEHDLSKKYRQNIMDALKKLVSDACKANRLEVPEFPSYKEKKREKQIPDWLTEAEQDNVIEQAPAVHRPIMMIIAYHGLRGIEARQLTRGDLHLDRGTITVRTAKGGDEREILLEPIILEAIKSIPPCLQHLYVFHYQGKPYKKNKLWKVIRQALDKEGYPKVTPKDFGRHSFGTQRTLRGQPTRSLQYEMGHSDIRTTEIYTHMDTEGQKKWRR